MSIITAAALVRVVLASLIPLFPDETYYWDWSRHLAPGYFDHPPGLAVVISLGAGIMDRLGARGTPLEVRTGTLVVGWLAAMATIATARRLGGDAAALRGAVLISVMPLAAAGLVLATPDAPLLAATAITLYCVVRALECPVKSTHSLRWWTAAGAALGLAFCSKYTSIFLPVAVLAAIASRRDLRPRLTEAGPYVACAVATIVFTPVLIWNARHGWVSVVFQLHHGLSAPEGSPLLAAWRHEGDFFGGQAGLASPILFVMLAIVTIRSLKRRAPTVEFVAAAIATLSFVFFVYSALRQRVEPNWPAPAYIPAIVLLATTRWTPRGQRWLHAGVALAALLSATIYVQGVVPILPLAPRKDPVARAFGWRDLTGATDSVARVVSDSTGRPTWLGADRYQEASELAFHDDARPPTFALNIAGRRNQYELWPQFADRARVGDNLVLVLDPSDDMPGPVRSLLPHFEQARRSALVALNRGQRLIGQRQVWILRGWRGSWPEVAAAGPRRSFY